MKLEELKKMIKEEFDKFAPTTPITNEAEDDVDVSVDDTDIDADTEISAESRQILGKSRQDIDIDTTT